MSHFLLASRAGGFNGQLDGRYAEEAVSLMLASLERRGVAPAECEAKLFGGGNMFPLHGRASEACVGHRNGHAARKLIQDRGIAIVSESLFGDGHRRIIFDIDSGTVWSRQVEPAR